MITFIYSIQNHLWGLIRNMIYWSLIIISSSYLSRLIFMAIVVPNQFYIRCLSSFSGVMIQQLSLKLFQNSIISFDFTSNSLRKLKFRSIGFLISLCYITQKLKILKPPVKFEWNKLFLEVFKNTLSINLIRQYISRIFHYKSWWLVSFVWKIINHHRIKIMIVNSKHWNGNPFTLTVYY